MRSRENSVGIQTPTSMGSSPPNGTDRSVVARMGRLGAVPSDGHGIAPRDEGPSEDLASPRMSRWGWPSVAVVLAYLALGMIAYWSAIPDFTGRLAGSDGDFIQSVWFIGWIPHALDHWLNPFFSNAMYAPTGLNLAQNTASPFLGLLTYPISRLAGPLASANLLMVLAMPMSATAAFVVLRKWNVWGPAAALGGAIYGFSPYMVGQGLDHVELIFIPIPPFIALTIEAILHHRGNPRRLGIQLGALVVVQYLISPEVMADVALLSIAALVCIAVRNPAAWRMMARDALEPMTIAIGVVAVALAYPLWMLLAGPQRYTGPTQSLSSFYYNDLLSFVIPGPLQRVSFGMESQWGGPLGAIQPVEDGGYIGIPLLLLAAAFAWRWRRRARMQLTVVLLAVSGLLTLGSSLHVGGHATHVPLPFTVLKHIPLLNDIQPSRISFATSAFIAAVIAFGLDDWHLRQSRAQDATVRAGRWHVTAAPLLATLTLIALVVSQFPSWPYPPEGSTTALPVNVERAIPPGNPITIAYPYTEFFVFEPLLWQSASGYKFSILGGYARHSNAKGSGAGFSGSPIPMNPPELQQFLLTNDNLELNFPKGPSAQVAAPPITPRLLKATRTALLRYRVRVAIVDRTFGWAMPVLKLFHDVLGPPNYTLDGFSLWVEVQRALKHRAATPAVVVHGASPSITGSPVVSGTDAVPLISRAGR